MKASHALAIVVLLAVGGFAAADVYTWVGASNGDWLDAGNWSPASPAFDNTADDVCDVNSGGTVSATTATAMDAQLNINADATLNIPGYGSRTANNLHFNGGQVVLSSATVLGGVATVDSHSTLRVTGSYNDTFSSPVSGSGDLDVIVVSTNTLILSGSGAGYAGTWSFSGGGYTNIKGDPGIGGMVFQAGSNCRVSVNTTCDWTVDLQGAGELRITYDYGSTTHTGQITLLSDSVLNAATDGYSKKGTLNGKVTGAARLTTRSHSAGYLVLGSSLNDYSGGTRVDTGRLQVTAANGLGTGNVQVDPGTQLLVTVSDTMDHAADLYLDFDGGTAYGTMDLGGAAVVTTVHSAFIGGLGGWDAPVGYTQLAVGDYIATDLPNYLTGGGTLRVLAVPEPATMGLLGLGLAGLAAMRRRRR